MYFQLTPLQRRIAAVSLLFMALGLTARIRGPAWDSLTSTFDDSHVVGSSEMDSGESEVLVHLAGEVSNPGVYAMDPGDRVVDALQRAGGVLAEADEGAINMAALLEDGERIVVPSKSRNSSDDCAEGRIDLNGAGAEELEQLHGIGPVLAERILTLRRERGGFESVEELLDVSGVGVKTLDRIREELVVH